jgi:DNA-directed RNA polymerase sigma subunit (sigma70/sigma32)
LLSTLPERERTVLAARATDVTLKAIGAGRGVTRERIRQIEGKAIAMVRGRTRAGFAREA